MKNDVPVLKHGAKKSNPLSVGLGKLAPRFNGGRAFVILFFVVGLTTFPLWGQAGLINTRGGGDSPFLLQRTHQLVTALGDGHFPVRWMPDANYGFGYPFFTFYAPLSIYIAGIFHIIGFNIVTAIKASQILAFVVAAWGMYKLGKGWWGENAGILAATAYTVAPFHLVNVYVRGDSLAEFWAMAFYPLCLLAVDRMGRGGERGRGRGVIFLAVSYAGLILSHNISALIFSPFLLLYILISIANSSESKIQNLKSKILPLFLALALSAWFWMPAISEQHLAQLDPVTEGYFYYSQHFRGADLVQQNLLFDYDVDGGGAFRMGLVQVVLIGLGVVGLIFGTRRYTEIRGRDTEEKRGEDNHLPPSLRESPFPSVKLRVPFLMFMLILSTAMITPLSAWLWEHLPLLSFTQFPWRFLSVQAFAGALVIGKIGDLGVGTRERGVTSFKEIKGFNLQSLISNLIILFLLITALVALRPDHYTPTAVTGQALAEYEWFTGNIGTTVSAEYLPPTVQPRPFTSAWLNEGIRHQATVLAGNAAMQLLDWRTDEQVWEVVVVGESATVRLPTLLWAGWQATLDGETAPIQPAEGSGLMVVEMPAGEHILTLKLGKTRVRFWAELLSLGALLGVLWWGRPRQIPQLSRRGSVGLIAGILLLIILRIMPAFTTTNTTTSTNTWDFAQLGYLHANPDGVRFADGTVLLGYAMDEVVNAGKTSLINLTWQGDPPPTAQLALLSPAVGRSKFFEDIVPIVATGITTDGRTFQFDIPANAPAGLYVPRLILPDNPALTETGLARGDLFLQPIRVVADNDSTPPSTRPLDVRAVAVQPQPNRLDLQLAWWTDRPLSPNLNMSLRLSEETTGNLLAQFDTQGGFGYQPSSLWQPQLWTNDWLAVRLNAPLPPQNVAVTVRLYDVADDTVYLTRRLGTLVMDGDGHTFQTNQPEFELPTILDPIVAHFGDAIDLRGYALRQTDDALELTLYWKALADGTVDYNHFVHLFDPHTETIMVQDDAMPRQNSYPTSQWVAGEIVEDGVRLDLTGVPTGTYQLSVGLFWQEGEAFPRMPAFDANNAPLPDNRLILPIIVTVE